MDLENKTFGGVSFSEIFNECDNISKEALIAYEFTQKDQYVHDKRSSFTKFLYKYIL